jgi:hypothetical protein
VQFPLVGQALVMAYNIPALNTSSLLVLRRPHFYLTSSHARTRTSSSTSVSDTNRLACVGHRKGNARSHLVRGINVVFLVSVLSDSGGSFVCD